MLVASDDEFAFIKSLGGSAANGMILTLIIPICFMFCMTISMDRVWSLYNTLQVQATLLYVVSLVSPS
jgi:hypothetical protein